MEKSKNDGKKYCEKQNDVVGCSCRRGARSRERRCDVAALEGRDRFYAQSAAKALKS
jgi:hypothetical protein